ncbi:hypothetical protein [Mycobacterium sp. 1465703.0]|uniref:hypothetical protein n=1 Tax=Mycobacterium sp. 1465703.0 TaxID=1834078 RepID=UPI000A956739|nr:hypothetical protein [Mycobacterium sp. 1465703.0]
MILLEGPASATQILERVNEATGGALNPPEHIVELAIGLLAARGFVSIDDGVATPTELGRSVLAWRGVTSESAAVFLKQAARFAEVFKLRTELFEVAGLARSIAWSGTEEQKATLSQVRIKVLDAVSEAKKELHLVLAES